MKTNNQSMMNQKSKIDCKMKFICPMVWGKLKATSNPSVKHCQVCGKDVHYCHNHEDLRLAISESRCVCFHADFKKSGSTGLILGVPIGLNSKPVLERKRLKSVLDLFKKFLNRFH